MAPQIFQIANAYASTPAKFHRRLFFFPCGNEFHGGRANSSNGRPVSEIYPSRMRDHLGINIPWGPSVSGTNPDFSFNSRRVHGPFRGPTTNTRLDTVRCCTCLDVVLGNTLAELSRNDESGISTWPNLAKVWYRSVGMRCEPGGLAEVAPPMLTKASGASIETKTGHPITRQRYVNRPLVRQSSR